MAEFQGTDYTARKKDVLVIRLGTREESFELRILPPTKGIHDGLVHVAGVIDDVTSGKAAHEKLDIGACFELVAAAMSNNTALRRITAEYLESIGFDLSDVADFLGSYLFFITELARSKN